MTHGVESVHSEYGIRCHSKKRVSGIPRTGLSESCRQTDILAGTKRPKNSFIAANQSLFWRPLRLLSAFFAVSFFNHFRAEHLRIAVQTIKVPENRFDPTLRNNRHENQSPAGARNTRTHPDWMRNRAAGLEARTQQ